jgi:hypothetical protein
MDTVQHILVYLTLALAIYFLAKKYILPKKKDNKACGKDGCGCH